MASVRLTKSDRGAIAVEFTLVLPLLITLVLGIMEFGHLYNAQIVMSNAAREAARTMAVTNKPGDAFTAAQAVAPGYSIVVSPNPLACDPTTKQVSATVTSNVGLITGSWLGLPANITISGVGVMRCGG